MRNLSVDALAINMMVDFLYMLHNVTFGIQVLTDYFLFFIVAIFFYTMLFLLKFKQVLYVLQIKYGNRERTQFELIKLKFTFKIIFLFSLFIFTNQYFIIYYQLYFVLLLYPLFQIWHNCFKVIKENCFIFQIHAFYFLPSVSFFLCLKLMPFHFFSLKKDR